MIREAYPSNKRLLKGITEKDLIKGSELKIATKTLRLYLCDQAGRSGLSDNCYLHNIRLFGVKL